MTASDMSDVSHGHDPLDVAISRTVKAYRAKNGKRGAEGLAPVVGMQVGTLQNKATLNQEAQLNLHEFRSVLLATGDLSALDILEADCGRIAIPVEPCKDTGDIGVLESYAGIGVAHGKFAEEVLKTIADGRITQAEIRDVTTDVEGEIRALQKFLARLKEVAEPA